MIPSEVTILCWSRPETPDLNFVKVAEFLGVKTSLLTIDGESATPSFFEKNLPQTPVCLVASGHTIAQLCSRNNFDSDFKSLFFRRIAHCLIYALQPDPRQTAALTLLSGAALSAISPVGSHDAEYRISPNHRNVCRQLTGLSLGPVNRKTDVTFLSHGDTIGLAPLITIGTQAHFAAVKRDECSIFAVGCNTVADIDESISKGQDILPWFSRLFPVMMFLKHVFKEGAWHAQKSYANFTVDDPLLQEHYGFLDYRKLLGAMDSSGFSTTIAFIPWNFKRTDSATAALLKSRPDKFSIVPHGCDHTTAEFNSNDVGLLSRKTREAIRRMQLHHNITGLPFERVMIFPQGIFSTAAMKTLKANNFLAAVNSTARPASGTQILRLRDLLDVAIMNYESFPLFVRRNPGNLSACALDLFLGKPLLLVEHHGYFRKGYDEIAEFASRVNALDDNLSWHGLGHVLDHASLSKKGPGLDLHMKLYAHNACIMGMTEQERTYRISKADSNNLRVESITLSGRHVPFTREGDALILSLRLARGAGSFLKIIYENPWNASEVEYRLPEHFKVFVRRRLSEIRDKYVARNAFLLSLADRVRDLLARLRP